MVNQAGVSKEHLTVVKMYVMELGRLLLNPFQLKRAGNCTGVVCGHLVGSLPVLVGNN